LKFARVNICPAINQLVSSTENLALQTTPKDKVRDPYTRQELQRRSDERKLSRAILKVHADVTENINSVQLTIEDPDISPRRFSLIEPSPYREGIERESPTRRFTAYTVPRTQSAEPPKEATKPSLNRELFEAPTTEEKEVEPLEEISAQPEIEEDTPIAGEPEAGIKEPVNTREVSDIRKEPSIEDLTSDTPKLTSEEISSKK
jgi:hypothetical protein